MSTAILSFSPLDKRWVIQWSCSVCENWSIASSPKRVRGGKETPESGKQNQALYLTWDRSALYLTTKKEARRGKVI